MMSAIIPALVVLAASGISMQKVDLKIPGHINAALAADIDGDGDKEILVFWRQGSFPKEKYRVSVYGGPKGEAGDRALQVMSLPDSTAGIDVGDVDGDGRADVLLLKSSGVEYLRGLQSSTLDKSPRALIKVMTLAAIPGEDFIPQVHLLVDLGKGKKGILLPTVPIGGLSLYSYAKSGRWELLAMMRVPARENLFTSAQDTKSSRDFSSLFQIILPRFDVVDFDGDGQRDLVFFSKDRISVFIQSREGKFGNRPDLFHCFGLLKSSERRKGSTRIKGCAVDLNGDARADLVFNKGTGGIANAKSDVFVFLTRAHGDYAQRPDLLISSDGYGAFSKVVDVDGDGSPDLVRPYVKMGIMAMGQVLMTGRLDVEFNIHPCHHGALSKKALISLKSAYSVNFRSNQELRGLYPIFGTDFSGDGRPDVLLSQAGKGSGKKPDLIQILPGQDVGFSDEPVWSMKFKATNHVQVYRPTEKSLPGILMFINEGKSGDVFVITNQGST